MTTMRLEPSTTVIGDQHRVRRYSRLAARRVVLAADIAAAGLALALTREPIVLVAVALAVLYWQWQGLCGPRYSLSILDDIGTVIVGGLWGLLVLVVVGVPPGQALVLVATFIAADIVFRATAYHAVIRWRVTGRLQNPVVVIGAGLNGVSLVERILDHPRTGLQPVGFLDDVPPEASLPFLFSDPPPNSLESSRSTALPTSSLPTVGCPQVNLSPSCGPVINSTYRSTSFRGCSRCIVWQPAATTSGDFPSSRCARPSREPGRVG